MVIVEMSKEWEKKIRKAKKKKSRKEKKVDNAG
jgi:hypothetical protein